MSTYEAMLQNALKILAARLISDAASVRAGAQRQRGLKQEWVALTQALARSSDGRQSRAAPPGH